MSKCKESLLCFHFPVTCPVSLLPSPTLSFEMWRISSLITLTFTLAISCLTTSNWPWFMNLTFQVPMQYGSLQHRTLLSPPDTSTTEWLFCFNPAFSFFLELFLHYSPSIWDTYQAGGLICLFIVFMGFSRQEYCSGLDSFLPWTTFCQTLTRPDRPRHVAEWHVQCPG